MNDAKFAAPLSARVGAVEELWIFPVKSLSGSLVTEAEFTSAGVAGDRSWAMVAEDGSTLTAKQEPRLREASARVADGELLVDVPGHGSDLPEPAAEAALSQWLGRTVQLRHETGGFVDVAPVHLVSRSSITDAEHAEECDACDIAAPRANVVVRLADGAANEREWVGAALAAGAAELVVVKVPKHCLGVYADVRTPGGIKVGDHLSLSR